VPQSFRNHLQDFVTRLMAAEIIDLLEIVDVNEEEGAAFPLSFHATDGRFQFVFEETPIGKPGNSVVQRHLMQLALGMGHPFPQSCCEMAGYQKGKGADEDDAHGVLDHMAIQ
jgi:hypothetical protein